MTEPMGYIDFLSLTSNARIVLTDSGGLQEESTALGIPCLTLRENTERPATVTDGTNRIVGMRTAGDPGRLRRRHGRPRVASAGRRSGTARRRRARPQCSRSSSRDELVRVRSARQEGAADAARRAVGRLQDEVRQQTKRPWASAVSAPAQRSNGAWKRRRCDAVVGGAPAVWSVPSCARPIATAGSSAFRSRYPGTRRVDRRRRRTRRCGTSSICSAPAPSTLGDPLPWHSDFKTGREWPVQFCKDIEYLELDRPSDVKVPWELSRAQHFPLLGQAYWLTGDERYAREFVAEVDDWIDRNPLGYGVNWACAMDVALRAANWMWGFYFMGAAQACADERLPQASSSARSTSTASSSSRNLETSDINGNHYLSDARRPGVHGRAVRRYAGWRALARDRRADPDRARSRRRSIRMASITRRSTPYHRLVLELFLTGFLLLEKAGTRRAECGLAAPRADARFRGGVHETERPGAARRRCRRWPRPEARHAGSERPSLPAVGLRGAVPARVITSVTPEASGDESFWLLGPDGAAAFDALHGGGRAATIGGVSRRRLLRAAQSVRASCSSTAATSACAAAAATATTTSCPSNCS